MTTRIILPIMSVDMMTYLEGIPNQALGIVIGGAKANLGLLGTGTHAGKSVAYDSAAELTTTLPTLTTPLSTICYNPEHRPQTPTNEQNNLVATVQAASATVHAAKKRFLLVSDNAFAKASMGQMAPFADIIILQGQRLQDDHATFQATIEPLITTIRGANPKAQVVVQVGVGGTTAEAAYAALGALTLPYDGVSIWASAADLAQVAALVTLLG